MSEAAKKGKVSVTSRLEMLDFFHHRYKSRNTGSITTELFAKSARIKTITEAKYVKRRLLNWPSLSET